MCGRYTLTDPDPLRLGARFDVLEALEPAPRPRFNVAPTDPVLGVRLRASGVREFGWLRWGLVPGAWAREASRRPLINARAETLATQPAFADSFRERRCLIPADGFYEWLVDDRGKRPVWISRADGAPFAFAGVWSALDDGEAELHSCAIVTCEPNALVRPVHDRMPVILASEAEEGWLDPTLDGEALFDLLRPAPPDELCVLEVPDAVNDVREDGPHLIAPRAERQEALF